jgi:hypothetical protein
MHQVQTLLEAPEQRSHPVARPLCWTQRLDGARTRAAAGLLAVAVFLTGLLWAAPAGASDPRLPLPTPNPEVLEGYCDGFTAVITWTEFNQYIIHQTTAYDLQGHQTDMCEVLAP